MKRMGIVLVGIAASSLALLSFPAQAGATPPPARFAYVTNSSSNNISGYSVDPTTGAMTALAGSPFAAGAEPNSGAIDPTGRFLYATNESTSTTNPSNVSGFSIDQTTGALTPIAGSPFAAGIEPNSATIDPSGRHLYVANEGGSRTISVYTIDSSSGVLTPIAGSPFATGATGGVTDSIALDPSGRFAYVSQNSTPGHVLAYTLDPATGALTAVAGSPFAAGASTDTVVVDPSGTHVYAGNFTAKNVSAFTINGTTGALTPVAGSPFSAGGDPDKVTMDPAGHFLFTANDSATAGIGAFTVDPTTGALTTVAGMPFAAGSAPSGVGVDATGRFLYSANEVSGDVSEFTINAVTGVLTPIAGSPVGAGAEPGAVVLFSPLPPRVTSVVPATGPAAGGTAVTVSGTGFTGASAVTFGSVAAASFNVVSGTQLTATSPPGTAGSTVDVRVTTSSGTSVTSAADLFAFQAAVPVPATGGATGAGPMPPEGRLLGLFLMLGGAVGVRRAYRMG